MSDAWERMWQGFEYWAYSRGVNDRSQGLPYDPAHGGRTPDEQQLYADGWFDFGMGRDREEALRRWPDFILNAFT